MPAIGDGEAPTSTSAVDLRYRIDDGEVRVRASYPEARGVVPKGAEPEPDHRSFDSRGGEEDGFSQALDRASDGWGWSWRRGAPTVVSWRATSGIKVYRYGQRRSLAPKLLYPRRLLLFLLGLTRTWVVGLHEGGYYGYGWGPIIKKNSHCFVVVKLLCPVVTMKAE